MILYLRLARPLQQETNLCRKNIKLFCEASFSHVFTEEKQTSDCIKTGFVIVLKYEIFLRMCCVVSCWREMVMLKLLNGIQGPFIL